MPSINSIIKKLHKDYDDIKFEPDNTFWWSAIEKTVFFNTGTKNASSYLLHELSHALLSHETYINDVDLIKLERDAWEHAQNILAPKYDVFIDNDIVQDNLDTYRSWLYARSTCPDCEATGLQTKNQQYRCLSCGYAWRTNEAKLCALRRYPVNTK